MTTRRQFAVQLASLAALGTGIVPAAQAQQHSDLARLLVGFPPGGSTDNVARRLAEKLRGTYAANVLVDNKPGAGTQIAVSALKDAVPDGTTLLLSPPSPFTVYPYTYRKLPYALEDVAPVSMACTFPFALAVGPAVPDSVRTLQDFVAWAKANPGKASFGSPASGSTPHLVGSVLGKMAGIDFTHIAYRGDAPGLQDLMGGQVPAYSTVLGSYLPHLKSGRLRLLAVSGTERSSFAPDLPTYREQGFALDMTEWFGVFVPARTPAATVQRVADAMRAAVAQPDFVRGLAEFGMTARSSTPQELVTRLRAEAEQWRVHVKNIGFTADT
ncbi:twin-arginine translocation pathway signal protein [Acidovorax sp. Root267]|uniref:Bug family tripartite tricarboxylate transporter substrate binding protein n=1 Tax=Acidovorax sp. Root267 TaxID=1736505 RepID=UPI00070D3D2C|nr:Bug family tripartite tricarboxylate transporter substrate binding protein [Acidovorax sp. Root267]KRD16413.1 twin-arginine translocation pathway signal protein [Acidovorax sp. Root267]